MTDSARGGDDILTVTGFGVGSYTELFGDGAQLSQASNQGGNDILTISNSGDHSSCRLYGDASAMYGQGGDDILTVTGSGVGSDAELYGDGGGMYEGAQGGNDTLIGGDGNESLYGDARGYSFVSPGSITGGTDNLNGGAGDDQLWGGPNNDRFVFNVGSGNDVINDFNQGNSVVGSAVIEHDIINLIAYSIGGFDALKAVISDDSNGNAVIHLSANDSLTLVGVHTGALQASDFIV